MWPYFFGRWWLRSKAFLNKRRSTSANGRTQQSSVILHPLGILGHARREDVQKRRDPLQQQETHPNHRWRRGIDTKRDYVGEHKTGKSNKRGIWMKQWLMIQNCVALNATFRKKQEKQDTFKSPRETAGLSDN